MKKLLVFVILIINFSNTIIAEKIFNLKNDKIEIKENKIYDISKQLLTGKILLADGVSILNIKNGDIIEFDYTSKSGNKKAKGKVKNNFYNGETIVEDKNKEIIKIKYKNGLIEEIESSKYKEIFNEDGLLIKGIIKENDASYNDFTKFIHFLKDVTPYDAIYTFLEDVKIDSILDGIHLKKRDFYKTEWEVIKNSKKIISIARINELGIKFIIFYTKTGNINKIIRDDGDSIVTGIIENNDLKKFLVEDIQGEVLLKKEVKSDEELEERVLRIKEEFEGIISYYKKKDEKY